MRTCMHAHMQAHMLACVHAPFSQSLLLQATLSAAFIPELKSLNLRELKLHAEELGAKAEQLDEVDTTDDPKTTAIKLIEALNVTDFAPPRSYWKA